MDTDDMDEDFIKIAFKHALGGLEFDEKGLIEFAKEIVAAEREACAQVCETHRFRSLGLAAAIRARGNK